LRLAEESDFDIRVVRAVHDPASFGLGAIAEQVDDATAVVSVSHVQYATGHRLDLAALAALAHGHGALLAVDVAQSAGVVPIDVAASGVDVLAGHGGKWLCGETGAGFCYLRPELVPRVDPPILGWRSTVDPWEIDGSTIRRANSARRIEVSSISYLSRFVLAQSTRYILALGIENVLAHVLRLAAVLARGLERLGAEVWTPADDMLRAGIVAARFPGLDAR